MIKLLIIVATLCVATNAQAVTDLKVNYQEAPMALESRKPMFSWRMVSDGLASKQQAYRIKVVDSNNNITWDSGKVFSSDSVAIEYKGEELQPNTKYDWSVKVWKGRELTSEGESRFETGFMVDGDKKWSGSKWIGGRDTDLVFYSDYLTVFRVTFEVELDQGSESTAAAFVFGGNDFRLMNRNLNVQNVESDKDESFIALELDISQLSSKSGNAFLNIYRFGYSPGDSRSEPLSVIEIPDELINVSNQYDRHRFDVRSNFGLLTIFVNGDEPVNRITPFDPSSPPHEPQGININPVAFGGSIEPLGNPGDYISFPAVGDIGFWLKHGQRATFSHVSIKNFREPANEIFVAGRGASDDYEEIFVDQNSSAGIDRLDDGAYFVDASTEEFIKMSDPSRLSAPMLRSEFELEDKPIEKARLYATARGIYEIYINGSRVGESYFTPGLTQYNKHHMYQAYDVTSFLESGDSNVLGAWLGEGWWSGNSTYNGSFWNFFGDRQSLLSKLVINYQDGTTQEVNSHPDHWKVFHHGPIRYGSFFQGEVYDARLEGSIEGWSTPEYDDTHWRSASVVPLEGAAFMANENPNPSSKEIITSYDDMNLIGQVGESPSVIKALIAKSVDEVRPGVFVYDMGQNMVGFPRVELSDVDSGSEVLLRFAEVRYPDLPEHEGQVGMVMMENIRGALAHDLYIARGGKEVIQPRFTFHGYRYIEITGIDEALPLSAVKGMVVSSVSELTADYRTSNDMVNKLWENITWSMRGNFLSIPTDTPARNERMGWSGDINVFASTATLMANVNPFLKRHLMAMRDIQGENGRFTDVAPVGGGFGGILWGSAGITIPWELYQQYDDRDLLVTHYPAMRRYAEYLWSRRDEGTGILLEGPLGDWLSPVGQKNDNTLLWEAYHVRVLDIMARVANLLDKPEEEAHYRQRYSERKSFFNETYVDESTGRTVHSGMIAGFFSDPSRAGMVDETIKGTLVDTQASYAVPIAMNVFDEENMQRAQQRLSEAVGRRNVDDHGVERPSCSLMTGFIGTASMMEALADAGRDDLAYCLLQQESYPSWLYSVANGATTIWERLNSFTREDGFGGNNSMNSFNHYSFGAVGAWMINGSLGIQRDPEYPGFKQFVLRPTPDPTGGMTWAKGHYDSMYGRIESHWSQDGENVVYDFVVPENTIARLHLLANTVNDVEFELGDSDHRPELKSQEKKEGRYVYKLQPGQYRFVVTGND